MSALSGPKPLGDRLLESGLITRTQLDTALEHQAAAHGRRRLGRMLVELGFLNDHDLSHMLSVHLAIPVLPFSVSEARADAVASIPAVVAHRHRALPCRIMGGSLLVAVGEALSAPALAELCSVSGRPVLLYLASESQIDAALLKHYGVPPMEPARLQHVATRVQQIADHADDVCVRAELELVRDEIDALISAIDDRCRGMARRAGQHPQPPDTDCTHCISTGGPP